MDLLKRIGWLNLLLVFVPISIGMRFAGAEATWLFATACVAIIPLAGLMGKSTEMIAHRLGPGIGGLMNASFGNAAEMIIAIFALKAGLIDVVKASITGSILGNILLVLGLSFFCGGVKYRRQKFNATAAGMSATLLVLGAVALLVPAVFHNHIVNLNTQSAVAQQKAEKAAAAEPVKAATANSYEELEFDLSLEIAIVLIVVYALMLLFSLKTHKHLYNPEDPQPTAKEDEPSLPSSRVAAEQADEHDTWPQWLAVTVLIGSTVMIAVMSELLVGAIEETAHQLGWTELFVGVIVIAIIGNAAEHSTAIFAAMKNKMELGFQIAVGSGLQIALFVGPALLLMSYLPIFPYRLDLIFSMLEVVAVAVSVLIVGLVAYDGRSNWMEGLLLLAVYLILGIAFYNLPG